MGITPFWIVSLDLLSLEFVFVMTSWIHKKSFVFFTQRKKDGNG